MTVRNNATGRGGSGGGIDNDGTMRIDRSTISHNGAGPRSSGGGIFSGGAVLLRNSTVSHNNASISGGISSGGQLTVRSSTIAFNEAWEAGGAVTARGSTSFMNTIVARNTHPAVEGGTNCSGALHSLGHNLENGTSCGFDRPSDVRADPRLGPLEDNGGPTLTHRLLGESPALDAGGSPFPLTDQRGIARPQGAASDIGAYEREGGRPGGGSPCTLRGTSGNDVIRGTPGRGRCSAGRAAQAGSLPPRMAPDRSRSPVRR